MKRKWTQAGGLAWRPVPPCFSWPACPDGPQVAIAGKAGSLGLGLELTVGISPQVNARLGANGFNYTDDRRRGEPDRIRRHGQAAHRHRPSSTGTPAAAASA